MINNRSDGLFDSGRRLIVGRVDKLIVQRRQRRAARRFHEQNWKDRKTLQLSVGCVRVLDRIGEFDMSEARAADCVWGNLDATPITDHALVAVALVFTARAFEIVDWAEGPLIVQSAGNVVVKRGRGVSRC